MISRFTEFSRIRPQFEWERLNTCCKWLRVRVFVRGSVPIYCDTFEFIEIIIVNEQVYPGSPHVYSVCIDSMNNVHHRPMPKFQWKIISDDLFKCIHHAW